MYENETNDLVNDGDLDSSGRFPVDLFPNQYS